jgi:trehalose 6-phosphate phosphatase
MRHLLSARGEAALAALMRRRPLLAFDFDGTLAPIVARPEDARVPATVAARLAVLALRLPVAIVTGRAIGDVRHRLGFDPQYLVGNHGAEDDHHDADDSEQLMHALDPLRRLVEAERGALAVHGVDVEDKGLSMALHYRLSPQPQAALALIEALVAQLPPTLQVFAGKMVVNAIASRAPDKADAVRRLQARCSAGSVFFAGDDINDEPVFEAATRRWLTVRIGRDERPSRARFFLDDIDQVAPVLERMLACTPG